MNIDGWNIDLLRIVDKDDARFGCFGSNEAATAVLQKISHLFPKQWKFACFGSSLFASIVPYELDFSFILLNGQIDNLVDGRFSYFKIPVFNTL
jgi:hypothetical protein